MVTTLCIAVRDPNVIQSFGDYTKYFIIETFERKNKIYNISEAEIGTEDALFKVIKQINDLKLRSNIEDHMMIDLISLQTSRRAAVYSVFPPMHFFLLSFLSLCIMSSFIFECSSYAVLADSPAVITMYAGMTGCLCWTFNLLSDLSDPFSGEYWVSRTRVMENCGSN